MERVAFLLEQTNERLMCMLNPESLVIRRQAGVKVRTSSGGQLTGAGLADDPLLYTGGGRTELELELLFDVHLAGSTITTEDVRLLTGPFWNLSENRLAADGYGQPPLVRFIWGKYWNIPGVIVSVAERLEDFTAAGAPQRSWMRMKLLRVREPAPANQPQAPDYAQHPPTAEELEATLSAERMRYYEVTVGDRLDEVAARHYGSAIYWRLLAEFNGLDDPNHLTPGAILQIPPAPALVRWLMNQAVEAAESTAVSFATLLRVRSLSPLRTTL